MRRIFALLALTALFTTGAFAHGGKSHKLMGTVQRIHENQVTITTTANQEASVTLTDETKYEKEGQPTDRSALVQGARVSVQLDEGDKIAVKVKIGGGGEHQR